MSSSLQASETVIPAWRMAVLNRGFSKGLVFHSDRGVLYACREFRNWLDPQKTIRSMSRKGNCWDNAVAFVQFIEANPNNTKQLVFSILRAFGSRFSILKGGQLRSPKTQLFLIVNRYLQLKKGTHNNEKGINPKLVPFY